MMTQDLQDQIMEVIQKNDDMKRVDVMIELISTLCSLATFRMDKEELLNIKKFLTRSIDIYFEEILDFNDSKKENNENHS